MKKQSNPQAAAAILEVVDNQLRDLDPPETMETYKRLMAEGHSDEEARRLIGVALLTELNDVLKNNEVYNAERYLGYLRKLPKLPWD